MILLFTVRCPLAWVCMWECPWRPYIFWISALIVGGETSAVICQLIYKKIIPVMIYVNTIAVIVGLLTMYLAGEKSLTPSTPDKWKREIKYYPKYTKLGQSISIRIGA